MLAVRMMRMPATMSLSLPVIDETDAAVETLKFLSDGNRLRILQILSQRESCVCELIEQIGLTQPLGLLSPGACAMPASCAPDAKPSGSITRSSRRPGAR